MAKVRNLRLTRRGKLFVATDEDTGLSAIGESSLAARSRLERHKAQVERLAEEEAEARSLPAGELTKDLERGD